MPVWTIQDGDGTCRPCQGQAKDGLRGGYALLGAFCLESSQGLAGRITTTSNASRSTTLPAAPVAAALESLILAADPVQVRASQQKNVTPGAQIDERVVDAGACAQGE